MAISAAASTWEGHVQTGSNINGNNKVPSIVWMEPMNNATQSSKKNKPETLQDTYEEWAQELGLARYQLLLKTGPQLKELFERKVQRAFEEVSLAALPAQGKVKEDLARARMLTVQRKKISDLQRIMYKSHGLNKNESNGDLIQQIQDI